AEGMVDLGERPRDLHRAAVRVAGRQQAQVHATDMGLRVVAARGRRGDVTRTLVYRQCTRLSGGPQHGPVRADELDVSRRAPELGRRRAGRRPAKALALAEAALAGRAM